MYPNDAVGMMYTFCLSSIRRMYFASESSAAATTFSTSAGALRRLER